MDNLIIHEGLNHVVIIIDDVIVDNNILSWHEEDYSEHGERYISLNEISEQLLKIYEEDVIYVWEEKPSEGLIYQYGNSTIRKWQEHGRTKGYA